MYVIKYHPLKERLRDRAMSDREALPYLIVFAAFTALAGSLPMFDGYNLWDGISAFLSAGIAVGGIFYAYHQNGGSQGYDLIQKYVVLGWVVSVRFLLVGIPVLIVLNIFGDMFGLMLWDSTGPYDIVIVSIAEAILYQRIGRHIRDTKNESSELQQQPSFDMLMEKK